MFIGSSTSHILQAITSAVADIEISGSVVAVSTATPPVVDGTNTTDFTLASITTATTTSVVIGAASITKRIDEMQCRNNDASTSCDVTFQRTDGTNTDTCYKATLLAGESISYSSGIWVHYDSNGLPKLSPGSGAFIQSTLLTAGTTFTTNTSTRTIRLRMVAGGGGGAGCTSVAAAASAGGGGAAGGYAEKVFAVSPNTGYTYAIGAAGTGASGAAGNTGGNTTFAVGATTVTCTGGPGAPVATAVTTLIAYRGGLSPVVSTNGDLNVGGDPGSMGLIYIAAGAGVSGKGGSSPLGSGGSSVTAAGNGLAALGFGSGGGGALTGASAVRTGGNGTVGCIIVDEYT